MEFDETKEGELLALFTFLEKKDLSGIIKENWGKSIRTLMRSIDKKFWKEYNDYLNDNNIETTTEKPVSLFNALSKNEFIYYLKDRYSTEEEKK